jgi:anti-anti-sigma factor
MKIISIPESATFQRVFVDSQAFSLRLSFSKLNCEAGLELLNKIESWVAANALVNSNSMPLLVLDLQEVDFLDSDGLEALLEVRRTLRSNGSNIVLCSLHASVKLVLEISKSDRAFAIFDTFDDFVVYVKLSEQAEELAAA